MSVSTSELEMKGEVLDVREGDRDSVEETTTPTTTNPLSLKTHNMSTSHSTGFPITTYSVPGEANMLADERVSFARGQRHNQADVSDAIELMSAKNAHVYLFRETEKRYPDAYHALSSLYTFLNIDLMADELLKAIDSLHSLESEHSRHNNQDSSICRALRME
ncbi:hypothetical protein SERLA73DRAFT_80912, partial [Serpula lacrymans var. lacrymans S7.3]